jgi:hypothetical protein
MVQDWACRQCGAMKTTGRDQLTVFPGQGFSPRDLTWFLLREDTELTQASRGIRDRFGLVWPELAPVQDLILAWRWMVRDRRDSDLDGWRSPLQEALWRGNEAFNVRLETYLNAGKLLFKTEDQSSELNHRPSNHDPPRINPTPNPGPAGPSHGTELR